MFHKLTKIDECRSVLQRIRRRFDRLKAGSLADKKRRQVKASKKVVCNSWQSSNSLLYPVLGSPQRLCHISKFESEFPGRDSNFFDLRTRLLRFLSAQMKRRNITTPDLDSRGMLKNLDAYEMVCHRTCATARLSKTKSRFNLSNPFVLVINRSPHWKLCMSI